MESDTLQDHLRCPCNCGVMDNASAVGTLRNPACADEVTLYLKIENEVIIAAWHQVRGCLLCKASASILCEKLEAMRLNDAWKLCQSDVRQWISFPLTPGRIDCAALPFNTLKQTLQVMTTVLIDFELGLTSSHPTDQ